MSWRVVTYRLGRDASRHRVGVWRELRRVGALALQSATWAIPAGDRFDEGLAKAVRLVERAEGQILVFDVAPTDASRAALEALYTAEREAEWSEFCSECDKVLAELRARSVRECPTPAEFDEEEHNLDRLRRRFRELRSRDLFTAPSSGPAAQQLQCCTERLEALADRVHEARPRP